MPLNWNRNKCSFLAGDYLNRINLALFFWDILRISISDIFIDMERYGSVFSTCVHAVSGTIPKYCYVFSSGMCVLGMTCR